MTKTTGTSTHRLIRSLIAATATCGGDAPASWLVISSLSPEQVRLLGRVYRLAMLTDGSLWLVVRSGRRWLPTNSVAYLSRLVETGRQFEAA